MLQSKITFPIVPTTGTTVGPYTYQYDPIQVPTGVHWNGNSGTVMEIHEVRFQWDFVNQYNTNPAAEIQEFGFESGGIFNAQPSTQVVGPQQAEICWTAGLRQGKKKVASNNKFPNEASESSYIAISQKGTYVVLGRPTVADRFAFSAQNFEKDLVWNYRDGVGNGLRIASDSITLHLRVDWQDTLNAANNSNKVIEPPGVADAALAQTPPMYVHVWVLYKFREVDIYEFQRLSQDSKELSTPL